MKTRNVPPTGRPQGRRIAGRAQDDHIIDPYRSQAKFHEPTVCPGCRAVFHDGTWRWASQPADAEAALCPACRRIEDKLPAGIVTLSGAIVGRRGGEIVNLIRHQESIERKEHPLNRIMDIEEGASEITVTTTDVHLPRRIGEAVRRAYHGRLELHYDEHNYFVRAHWSGGD